MQTFPVQVKPVRAKPAQEKPFLGKKAPKAGNLGRYLAGQAPRRRGEDAPKQACFSRRQGQCAGTVRSGVAYNFCIEGKTSLLVRWAFHLCEPCDVGICISQ